jgi:hypothetical protein
MERQEGMFNAKMRRETRRRKGGLNTESTKVTEMESDDGQDVGV